MADEALAVNHYSGVKDLEKGRFLRSQVSLTDLSSPTAISTPAQAKKTCKFKALGVADITRSEVLPMLKALPLRAKA